MRMTKFPIIILAVGLFTASCENPTGSSTSVKEEAAEQNQTAQESEDGLNTRIVSEITDYYLELKLALVEGESPAANKQAKNIVSVLNNTEEELLQNILEHAENLSDADDLSGQRIEFEKLSGKMYELLTELDTERDLYWQYCPMAFDGKGANWISDSEEIMNPYFGDKMLHCGRVEEEI